MTWIKTIEAGDAGPELRRIYDAIYSLYPPEYGGPPLASLLRPDGKSGSIVAAHSLIPEAMRHMMSGLAVTLPPGLPLTRRQHELIATVASARHRRFY